MMKARSVLSSAARRWCASSARPAENLSVRIEASSQQPNASSVDPTHWDDSWDKDRLRAESQEHVMASWIAGQAFRAVPFMSKGEHFYLYDIDGNKYLDWTSQAVCVNLGYDVPPQVVDAVHKQLTTLPMSYGGLGVTEVRVRLAKLLSELLPGTLNNFLFPSSGSEANEAAIRMARRFTGRSKIINHYRGYHGGSPGSLQATGDFRRGFVEASGALPGFIKTFNPSESLGNFSFGETDEQKAQNALQYLEDQITMEGAHTIAAIMFESIVGAGGVYVAPPGYMEGVRELCNKHGILFICDEVMVGFGRTGKMWGFQHYDMVPDIVTSAKGLSGAYLPLSMVAATDEVKDYFETNAMGWGATYHAHPTAMACAYECIKFMLQEDLVNHAKDNIEPVLAHWLPHLADKFDSVARPRYVGAFGCVDLLDKAGEPIQRFDGSHSSNPEAVAKLRKALLANGIYGLLRPPLMHCAPALVIRPEELVEGFQQVEKALEVYDHAVQQG